MEFHDLLEKYTYRQISEMIVIVLAFFYVFFAAIKFLFKHMRDYNE
jgi:hypothetical protein